MVVIWAFAAMLIPVIRTVTTVESYYAFGFVSEFVIVSTTIFFVGDDVLRKRGITPGSAEAKALRFAGLRGMVASYAMLLVLITQKTAALPPILLGAACIVLFQLFIHRGGLRRIFPVSNEGIRISQLPGRLRLYRSGHERARDEARQHGVAGVVERLISSGTLVKFNVEPHRIRRLISHTHDILPEAWELARVAHDNDERIEEPSQELEECFHAAWNSRDKLLATIEHYSHYGIFAFIDKYSHNWAGVGPR